MTAAELDGGIGAERRSGRRPNGTVRSSVWALPRPVIIAIIAVEVAAAVIVGLSLRHGLAPLPNDWPWLLAALVVAGIVGTEATLGIERVRHGSEQRPHIDLSSVWAFAAAMLFPGPLAAGVVVALYLHIYLRVWRHTGLALHRVLFTTATIVLAVHAAAATIHVIGATELFRSGVGLVSVVLALLAYAVVNMVLVVGVIVLSGPEPSVGAFLRTLGRGDDAVLELATLAMGALVAGAMASFGPSYAVLVLPPLVVLHRTVLVRQLEEAASTDSKTGLLNAAAWHLQAGRELRRAERVQGDATVLVLDLDHFKLVNDRYGHLAGDEVLAAVAATIRSEVREDDLVGRFGGEEFVVLLLGVDAEGAGPEAVAERIRSRIAALNIEVPGVHGGPAIGGLSVSIGGATLRVDGTDLPRLLEVADAAMYAAKNAGRNAVRMGIVPGPCPRP